MMTPRQFATYTAAFLVASCCMFACSLAQAQDDPVDCNNALSQPDMNFCADKSYQKADAALNAVYKRLSEKLEAADKAKLVSAERSWIKRRDKECDEETEESKGGSIYPMEVSECLTEKTKARTAELKAAADGCAETDKACQRAKARAF